MQTQEWTIIGRTYKFGHLNYEVGCGGTETPYCWNGKHYLMVWNKTEKKHEHYCFEDDLFYQSVGYSDDDWQGCSHFD